MKITRNKNEEIWLVFKSGHYEVVRFEDDSVLVVDASLVDAGCIYDKTSRKCSPIEGLHFLESTEGKTFFIFP